jgi:RHS repeat-associated protein
VAYDANGNQTQQGTYDVSNRLVTSSNGQSYAYDYRGKRIVKRTGGTAELYFYGIDGKKLTTLQCDSNLNCSSAAYNVSFAGKLVQSKGYTVATDRLGSVRWTAGPVGYVYFPYGEERTISPNDTEKFGTYTRDSSGQDYADQRYYGVGTGRFWSVDPKGMNAADSSNPTSWNPYAYVNGDPISFGDPTGEDVICGPGMVWDGEGCTLGSGGATYANSPFSPSVTQSSIDVASGEMSYVLGTVVPGYFSSATSSDPNLQQIVFPNGAISAIIKYGPIAPSTLSGVVSAVTSAATYLPQQFYSGFVNALLNDDTATGALQVVGSLAAAVAPGAIANSLAPETLYHYTTAAAYESITFSGQIIPGMGITGWGVYGTAVQSAATVSWAGIPTDAVVAFSPGMSAVSPGLVPGLWWSVAPTVCTLMNCGVPIIPLP